MNVPENLTVLRVVASSRVGSKPDRVANRMLSGYKFTPHSGNSAVLHEGALPPSGSALRLHLSASTPKTGNFSLFLKVQDGEEVTLAQGRFLSIEEQGACLVVRCSCAPNDAPWAELSQITCFCVDSAAATSAKKAVAPAPASIPPAPVPVPVAAPSHSQPTPIGYRFVGTQEVLVSQVHPLVGQPRKYFHPGKLQQLANSIQQIGLQQLVQVRRISVDEPEYRLGFRFMLVDGERRLRAHKLISKREIGANIVEIDSKKDHIKRSLVLNFHREDHSHYEIACAVIQMVADNDGNAAQVARDLGKSPAWVADYLRLKSLDPELFKLLNPEVGEAKQLRLSHAGLLASMKPEEQRPAYEAMMGLAPKGVRAMDGFLKGEAARLSSGVTVQGRVKRVQKPSQRARGIARGIQHMEHTVAQLTADVPAVLSALDSSKYINREDLAAGIDKIVKALGVLRASVGVAPPQ